jgi:hypothetical protein
MSVMNTLSSELITGKNMSTSVQILQDILNGKRILPKNVDELYQVAITENWTDHKRDFMRQYLFPSPEEHEAKINAFYTIFDPYVPI